MALDLSSFKKAVSSLERAVNVASSREKMAELDADQKDTIRAGVIQNFEFTYELCWKMLKRRLEIDHPNPSEIDQMSFQGLLREGGERGLIEDVEKWMEYREKRNITAHTYDRRKAESVYKTAVEFVEDAKKLLLALEKFKSA